MITVRRQVVEERVLGAIRERLTSPEALAYIRQRVAAALGRAGRDVGAELAERAARLERVEQRIRGIITMQLDGDRSPKLAEMRQDFEAQAVNERGALAALRRYASEPVRLPDVRALAERVQELMSLREQPEQGREQLRRFLAGGQIAVGPDGVARAGLLIAPPLGGSGQGCAGAILEFPDPENDGESACWVPFDEVVAVGWG